MIQLISAHTKQLLGIEAEKIVNVKVVERKGGTAIVDINGTKIEARLETETPDNFLAFVEKQKDGIKLRILSSFKNTEQFSDVSKQKLLSAVKMFFLNNNIMFTESYLQAALKLYYAGLKLDKKLLMLVHQALLKYGGSFTNALVDLLSNGLVGDSEFLELFFYLKELYKKLLKNNWAVLRDGGIDSAESFEDEAKAKLFSNLLSLFSAILHSDYNSYLFRYGDKELLVQSKIKKDGKHTRYYFDISGEGVGGLLIRVDNLDYGYNIVVSTDKETYTVLEPILVDKRDDLKRKLNRIITTKQIEISFNGNYEDFAFFRNENEEQIENKSIGGLDLFA